MDLNACLNILSSRGKCEHESTDDDHKCPTGQTIDLVPTEDTSSGEPCAHNDPACPSENNLQIQQKSVEKFREELGSLGVKDLVVAFNKAQEERVATYRFFDEGLERVLGSSSTGKEAKSENMEGYSGVCAEATASFAALSNLVNAVEGLVKEQDKSHAAIAAIIRKVQLQEKEKLSVTAALHLEKVRLRDAGGHHALLREGVDRLQRRLDGTKHAIVELLDELKYETEPLFCDE